MNEILSISFSIITTAFLFLWGAYERISAIKTARAHPSVQDRDRGSLLTYYAAILSGYGVGIPVSFTDFGRIHALFPFVSAAGFVVVAAGLAIRLIAKRTLDAHFTYTVKIIENHRLITGGIYRFIRHPSYLGQSMIFLGCGLAFSNWMAVLFLFVPSFVAGFYRMAVEEKALTGHFADRYRDYMKRTWRLIPFVY